MNRYGAVILLLLGGCMAGPDYERPEFTMPEEYRGVTVEGVPGQSIADANWRVIFQEENLQSLIETGLSNNPSLAAAQARLQEAEARLTIARAPLYPDIGLGFNAEREYESALTGSGEAEDTISFLGLLSWELDFWGFTRRQAEAAMARLHATEYAMHAQQVSLIGAIAATYYNLLAITEQIALTEETISTRIETLRIQELRNRSGVISGLEVAQAKVALAEAEQALPFLRNQQLVLENQLKRLLGETPGPIATESTLADLPEPDALPSGVPSDLLQRRPDVVVAESELVAANAEIGVATANLFPRISLTAAYGVESADLSDILDSDGEAWIADIDVVQPIFNAGSRRAGVAGAEARRQQALLFYSDVVLLALQEVSNALDTYERANESAAATLRLRDASSEYLHLASARYANGVIGYIDVLDAQRQYFDAELALIDAVRNQHLAVAFLYRALGGGWEPLDDAES